MTEVIEIVKNRALVPLSTYANDPFILTHATLLTQKSGPHSIPPGDNLYKWQQVQGFANALYLHLRNKWTSSIPDITTGSMLLMKYC